MQDINDKNDQLIRSSQFDYSSQINSAQPDNFSKSLDIVQESYEGVIQQIHPDLLNSATIDEAKDRISRSIRLMSQFIDDFEGMRSRQGVKKKPVTEVHITVNNQISGTMPKKINLQLPETAKLSELKE